MALEHLSIVAHWEGKLSHELEMLDESYKVYLELADQRGALQALDKKAMLIADEGDFDTFREPTVNVLREITSGIDLEPGSLSDRHRCISRRVLS
jgi:hypothetical protein